MKNHKAIEKKTEHLNLTYTPSEKAYIKDKAAKVGMCPSELFISLLKKRKINQKIDYRKELESLVSIEQILNEINLTYMSIRSRDYVSAELDRIEKDTKDINEIVERLDSIVSKVIE